MSNEMVQQRIKYLVEHGEVFPQERRRFDKRLAAALATIIALQIADCAMTILSL